MAGHALSPVPQEAVPARVGSRAASLLGAALVAVGALLVYLLSSAGSKTPAFAGELFWLLASGVLVLLLLMATAGYQLLLLRRRLRQRVFGSKLTLRLVLTFALVAILPGALVYAVSVQFLTRSIDTWFDVRVETALEGGLSLGRRSLDAMQQGLLPRAQQVAAAVADLSPRQRRLAINGLREQAAVEELALLDLNGGVLLFSSATAGAVAPHLPTAEMLQRVRLRDTYSQPTSDADGRLLLRVLVPVHAADGTVEALQLVQPVPEAIARDAVAVQQAYGEFQELSYTRPGLKRLYALSLTLALLLSLFASLLMGMYFSARLSAPLGLLAEATRAVAQGDYREHTPVKGYDELRLLTRSFNAMTRDLADARQATERYQGALEGARASLESVLAHLTAGVVVLEGGSVHSANPGALRILGVAADGFLGRPLERWGELHPRLAPLAAELSAMVAAPPGRPREREFALPGEDGEVALLVKIAEIAQPGTSRFVLVLDDITNLIQAQRQAAWGEVARRLAHEIKNPLTPIQLSAERLQHRLAPRLEAADAELLSRLTTNIVNQVTALKDMVDAFSLYARAPDTVLRPLDLGRLAREVVSLYEGRSGGAELAVAAAPGTGLVQGDPVALRQVIHNLLANAEQAVSGVERPRITVGVQGREAQVVLSVTDNGPGFPAEVLARPVEPYVTTKARGTGLGLAIVKRIADEHGGVLLRENLEPGGARVSIALPALAQTAPDTLAERAA